MRQEAQGTGAALGLSIIIPFHNAEQNSERLLRTLAEFDRFPVEIICVDDGSTDSTASMLADFASLSRSPVTVITQQNSGPGSARNAGLRRASGAYVWFVDCDDDIRVDAIDRFMKLRFEGYDFIDFDIVDAETKVVTNTMDLAEGSYEVSSDMRPHLVRSYGALCTKIVRRELLLENGIWYPESCYFEDNLFSSVMPFFVERFHKVNAAGYVHHRDFASITRQDLNPKYFDRLHTAIWGLRAGLEFTGHPAEVQALEDRFIDLFILKTTNQIFGMLYPNTGFMASITARRYREAASRLRAHVLTFWFIRSWIVSARVHRFYREVAKQMNVRRKPLLRLTELDRRSRVPWRWVWATSFLLGRQSGRFNRIRAKAWGTRATTDEWHVSPRTSRSQAVGAGSH